MTLRKITNDNSVRYIPKSEQTRENKTKPLKAGSLARKQKQKFHKTIKSFLIMFQHQDSNSLNE